MTVVEVEAEVKEKKQEVVVYYANTPIPSVMEGKSDGIDPDHDFALAEVLQDQENNQAGVSGSASNNQVGQSSNSGNSLLGMSLHSQLLSDEALARQFQAVEDLFANTSLNELNATETGVDTAGPSSVNERSNSTGTSLQDTQGMEHDVIDPDYMTYEELQLLAERVGNESKGLSDELISYLPCSEYKSRGFLSRKDKNDECVICRSAFESRDKLITLPCAHHYHAECISTWLKINKACPVCKDEVFG